MAGMRKPMDHDVRERIITSRGRNLLVEAGAGTGKTRLMVDRLVSLLEDGEVSLDQMVVTTFTESAAQELKDRLRQELMKRLRNSDEDSAHRIQRSLSKIESASISTIHAFAAKLIRERPVEAGIDPNFELMDKPRAERLAYEVWERWRDEQLVKEPDRWRRLFYYFRLNNDNDAFWEFAKKLVKHRDLLRNTGGEPEYPVPEDYMERALAGFRKYARLADKCCLEKDDKLWVQGFAGPLEVLEQNSGLTGDTLATFLNRFRISTKKLGVAENWTNKEDLEKVRQSRIKINELLGTFRKDIATAVLADAMDLVSGYADQLQTEKKRQGLVDFTDLLILARNMLAKSAEARNYFKNRYKYLLIDEFQDTDPLQCEIVLYLTKQESSGDPWERSPLEPGKLFVVGDPKQSIYHFRRADIEVYEQFRSWMERDEHSDNEVIQVNFRCREEILAWVNKTFAIQMGKEKNQRVQAPYVDLEPFREEAPKGPAITYLPPASSLLEMTGKGKVEEYRRQEAHVIAGAIERIVKGGEWEVLDPDSGELVKADYRHIAVLYPKRTGLEIYEDIFRARSIPFISDGSRDYYKDPEVHFLVQSLVAIEAPHDTIAVAATLTGPLFAFTDEDLFLYASRTGDLNYLHINKEAAADVNGLTEAFEFLKNVHDERNLQPVDITMDRLLSDLRLSASTLMGPRGHRALNQLQHLRDRARLFQQAESLSFGEVASRLEEERSSETDIGELSDPDSENDQVQMLTFHKSKGLEFPIVFLANLSGALQHKDKIIPLRKEGRISACVNGGNGWDLQSEDFEEANLLEGAKYYAEQVRLLYVASTRARDHLLVSCFSPDYKPDKEKPKSSLDLLPDLGDLTGGVQRMDGVWVFPSDEVDIPEEDEVSFRVPIKAFEELPDPSLAARNADFVGRLEGWIKTASRSHKAAVPSQMDERELEVTGVGPDAEFSGKEAGNLFHLLMEQWDFDESSLNDLAMSLATECGRPEAGPVLVKWATQSLQSEIGRRLRKAPPDHLYREMPYCYVSSDGKLNEGTVDLVFREDDGWTVVDYKTNSVADTDLMTLAEHYRLQMEHYAEALKRLTGDLPKEMHLLFARHGKSIRL